MSAMLWWNVVGVTLSVRGATTVAAPEAGSIRRRFELVSVPPFVASVPYSMPSGANARPVTPWPAPPASATATSATVWVPHGSTRYSLPGTPARPSAVYRPV